MFFVVCAFRNYLPYIITLHHKLVYIQWVFISFHRNVFSENIMIVSKRMMIWLYNISNVFIKKSFKSYLRNVMHRYMILHTQSSILQTLTRFHLFFHRLLLMIYENIFFFINGWFIQISYIFMCASLCVFFKKVIRMYVAHKNRRLLFVTIYDTKCVQLTTFLFFEASCTIWEVF